MTVQEYSSLIAEIQKIGKKYDGVAQSAALEFARRPEKEGNRENARCSVAMSDVAERVANEVIELLRWRLGSDLK